MKITDLNFKTGCACCQAFDVAEAQINGAAVKVMRVPQEEGGVAYIVLVNRDEQPEQRHMKVTEQEILDILSNI